MHNTPTRQRPRTGFTLIETIVTIALLAVLAAFVIPSVIQKSSAGDPVKVQNDLTAIRTGLETFATDTKAGFPSQIWELTAKPGSAAGGSVKLVDSTTALTTNQIATWNGPYLALTVGTNARDSVATGFSGYVMNYLERYDVTHNVGELSGGATGSFNAATGTLFVAVRVDGLSAKQAAQINAMIDGASDPDQVDGSNTTGRFRYDAPATGSSTVVAYFMAAPIA